MESQVPDFVAITGCNASEALQLLEATGGDLEQAVLLFFAQKEPVETDEEVARRLAREQERAAEPVVRAPIPSQVARLYDDVPNPLSHSLHGPSPLPPQHFGAEAQSLSSFGMSSAQEAPGGTSRPSPAEQGRGGTTALPSSTAAPRSPVPPNAALFRLPPPVGVADSASSSSVLDAFFSPPPAAFSGSLSAARNAARDQGKWLLVNLLSRSDFRSHVLNRDVWRNETIDSMLRDGFVLFQTANEVADEPEEMRSSEAAQAGRSEGGLEPDAGNPESGAPAGNGAASDRNGHEASSRPGSASGVRAPRPPRRRTVRELAFSPSARSATVLQQQWRSSPAPTTLVIDPMTNTAVAEWAGVPLVDRLLEGLGEFLGVDPRTPEGARRSLEGARRRMRQVMRVQQKQDRGGDARSDETSRVSEAISVGSRRAPEATISSPVPAAPYSRSEPPSAPSSAPQATSPHAPSTSPHAPSTSPSQAAASAPDPAVVQAEALSSLPPEPAAPDGCRVALRLPSGRRSVRRFPTAAPCSVLRLWAVSISPEAAGGRLFRLSPAEGPSRGELDESATLADSGLAGAMVALFWEEA